MKCGEKIKEKEIFAVMQQLKELELEAEKRSRPRRDMNPRLLRFQCKRSTTELQV